MTKLMHLPNYHQARVLVFGDVMLDRYWFGQASRISPEAPVPVIHIENATAKPGGAGNVALNIARLGGQVKLFGLVGDDPEAILLRQGLDCPEITVHLNEVAQQPTITKLRVLGQNQQLIRMDFEKRYHIEQVQQLIPAYEAALAQVDVVVLSDYAKGTLQGCAELIACAKSHGIPVFVDPKQVDFEAYRGADLVTPNAKEFEQVVGTCRDEAEMVARAREVINTFDLGGLLITRGKHGMLLIQADGEHINYPTEAKDVYDVTGAGDTVVSNVAAAYAAGAPLEQAVLLSNLAAGIVVGKLGVETVSPYELRSALQHYQRQSQLAILNESEAALAIEQAHRQGETVVMTNGCFDVLHAGHVHYLEEAKALGDRLIVAVNTDDSVRALKGASRPVNPLAARMAVLAGLKAIDWVVPFSEDTPQRLIEHLKPDILVKGGDYQVHQIAGAESVLARGGRVKTLAFVSGYSTTSILEKKARIDLHSPGLQPTAEINTA